MSKLSFKKFLEEIDFNFDDMDSEGTEDHEDIDTEDGKLLSKLKPQGKGQKTNQGLKSDRSETVDAAKATKKANAAGM